VKPLRVNWNPCVRVIPSRFPPIALFERVALPEDLEAVYALEALTNDRIREEVGDLTLIPPEERTSGPGAGYVMAAFTHLNPCGSRFSPGSFGIYYAAGDLETAIAETVHHLVRRMRETQEAPQELDMQVLHAHLRGSLLTLDRKHHASLLRSDSYADSQPFGLKARMEGADGIHYPSVRWEGGFCAAVFKPRLLGKCTPVRRLTYPWDGEGIQRDRIYEKSALPLTRNLR